MVQVAEPLNDIGLAHLAFTETDELRCELTNGRLLIRTPSARQGAGATGGGVSMVQK